MRWKGAPGVTAVVVLLGLLFGHLLQPFDFLTFLHAGADMLKGRLPYASPSSPVFRAGHAFVYPLYVAWVFAPLAALPQWCAEALYAIVSVAAIVASCRLLGRRGFAAAGLVLVCSTTIIGLQMGTLNAFLLLGLACAWRWRDNRPLLAGFMLGATATAKLFLLPVLLWPLLHRRYGQAATAVASVVGLVLFSSALGSFSPLGYLRMMSSLDAREQTQSWSLSSLLQGLGTPGRAATAGAVLASVAYIAFVWSQRRRLSDGQLLAAVVLCSLLLSPILWSSYLLLLVVPLLLVPAGNRLLAGFALCSWAIVTPDAASPARVLAGACLAVLVVVTVSAPHLGGRFRGWFGAVPVRALVAVAALAAGFAGLMLVLPPPARSPLPAMAAIVAVAAGCLRPSAARSAAS